MQIKIFKAALWLHKRQTTEAYIWVNLLTGPSQVQALTFYLKLRVEQKQCELLVDL